MRRMISIVAIAALSAALVASAAKLTVDGGTLQVGQDTSIQCDTDGVYVDWGFEMNDGLVYSVAVGGISEDCVGAELFVNITDDGNVVRELGPVDLTASNTGALEASVSLGTPYSAGEITDVHIGIEGPTGA